MEEYGALMSWLEPEASFIPSIHSLAKYLGPRLIFNVGGSWRYYPSYESVSEYQGALDAIVHGAYLALGCQHDDEEIGVSMEPFHAHWIKWLLPMWDWRPGEERPSDWDHAISEYARLFEDGTLDEHYTGGCVSRHPLATLRFSADLVVRNYAPDSWLFSPVQGGPTVYFHNSTSFGVCVPDNPDYDPEPLVQQMEWLGLVYQP
jgi:hypothetical protein